MPHYWIAIGTPDDVRDLLRRNDWAQAKQQLYDELLADGVALDEVYFEPERNRAYVVGHTAEPTDTAALGDRLGADVVEVFTVEELGGYGGSSSTA